MTKILLTCFTTWSEIESTTYQVNFIIEKDKLESLKTVIKDIFGNNNEVFFTLTYKLPYRARGHRIINQGVQSK